MARTPEQDDVFLREVDDAVRKDQFATAAKRYGPAIGAAIVLTLGAFGGWLWYNDHRNDVAGEQGEIYVQALDRVEAGNPGIAAAALAELKASDNAGYSAAARFSQANIAAEAGDAKRAAALLAAISSDQGVAKTYRDLATIRKTAVEFDTLKPDAVIARLKPLATPESPWFATASEMTAIAHLRKNERGAAGRIFADIAARDDVEPSLKSRAVQMAGMLGVDAVDAVRADQPTGPSDQPTGPSDQPTGPSDQPTG